MNEHAECVDLRQHGNVPYHTYAYYRFRELPPGEVWEVLTDEEPALLMESVNLQLRHALAWNTIEDGPPLWRLQLRRREDTEAASLVDVLERDHLRLHTLFADAIHRVGVGDLARAGAVFQQFTQGLRCHIHAENELLAPSFQAPRSSLEDDPTSIMLREHTAILDQVSILETLFAAAPVQDELAPLFALLSGQMAKHEGREELNLFPRWRAALQQAPAGSEVQLVERLKAVLNDKEAGTPLGE